MTVGKAYAKLCIALCCLLFAAVYPAAAEPERADADPEAEAILIMGDSISAAYGMPLAAGWAALLEARLAAEGLRYRVVNASISGETTSGGAARLPELLARHRPAIVVIELGGNDGLRGYPIRRLRGNLAAMARQSQAAGARAVLLGMEIPPNYGSRYAREFRESFAIVARDTGSALLPFMLDGVAATPGMMQDDGIHPTIQAQTVLLDNVWPVLEPLLNSRQLDLAP